MPFLAPFIPMIASGVGAIVKGRSAGRQQEAGQNAEHDKMRLLADQNRLGYARFNREAPGVRASNAVRGDVLARAQPFQLSGEGRTLSGSGGLSPALFSSGTRDLGASMSRNAVLSQLAEGPPGPGGPGTYGRGTNAPMPDIYSAAPSFNGPTPIPQPGMLDKILGGAAIAGDAYAMWKKQQEEDQANQDNAWLSGGGRG